MQRIFFLIVSAFSLCNKDEYKALNEVDEFSLMTLPFGYKDLESVLWSQIVYFHHTKEHGKYIPKLNQVVGSNSAYESLTVTELIMQYGLTDKELALYAGGYYNHALFWWSLKPTSCSKKDPEGQLLADIEKYFVDFKTFQDEFSRRAISLYGNGWLWLCYTPDGDLKIKGRNNEYSPLGGTECYPLLGLDLWEHSYYLFYLDSVVEYVLRWWSLIDWSLIEYWYQEYTTKFVAIPV